MQKQELSVGSCFIEKRDDRFLTIGQDGHVFQYAYKKSKDSKFSVAWRPMLDYNHEKSNQVCLVEHGKKVLWTEDFRRATNCEVANDGTVAVLNLNPTPCTYKGKTLYQFLDSIFVIFRNGPRLRYDFGDKAEIMAFSLSPDGAFLVYNIQQYHPDNYELVLQNLRTEKEMWRHKYPMDQVIHELVFKKNKILVYSGPRPSAFIDRRYSFTLDFSGRRVEDDRDAVQEQKKLDSKATSADDVAKRVGQILTTALADVAPTIEVETEKQLGPKRISQAMTRIMKGECPLPALHINLSTVPSGGRRFAKNGNREEINRFFLHIQVIGRISKERDETAEKCRQALDQKEEELVKNNLAVVTTPQIEIIGTYPGSGPYPRSRISAIVEFPSKEKRKKPSTFESVFTLQPNEIAITVNDVIITTGNIRIEGKIALTTHSLHLFMKNPISGSYSTGPSFSPSQGKIIQFGQNEYGKYFERKELRLYFKEGNQEFEAFRKKFDSWVKSP